MGRRQATGRMNLHFEGQEVVSLATRRAMRNVVATSFAVIIIRYHDVNLDDFTIFELTFGDGAVDRSLIWIHGYLLISWLVSWTGDLFSLGRWNAGETTGESGWDGYTELMSRTGKIISTIEDDIKQQPHELKQRTHDELRKLNTRQTRHRTCFLLYFYGWHLTVPFLLGICAVCLWFAI